MALDAGIELETCDDCHTRKLCVYVASGDPYCGAYTCLACVCREYGVAVPPGPYKPRQPEPPPVEDRQPALQLPDVEIDPALLLPEK